MDADLKSLEIKVEALVQLCQRLREDNQHLRQQLASSMSTSKRLEEKVGSATTRLEALLAQMPVQDDA
jgi:cell division protein ZapB